MKHFRQRAGDDRAQQIATCCQESGKPITPSAKPGALLETEGWLIFPYPPTARTCTPSTPNPLTTQRTESQTLRNLRTEPDGNAFDVYL